jgi:hypothetical protein
MAVADRSPALADDVALLADPRFVPARRSFSDAPLSADDASVRTAASLTRKY